MSTGLPTHFPNMVEHAPIGANGLVCWRDKERPCAPDCMAFIEPPEGADYAGKQWANCLVLVNEHRTGKHLTILAQVGGELVKARKVEAADKQRLNQPPIPKVT